MALNLFEIREALIMAFDAIRANKLRSFLTVLGVMIGVSSVIGMVSLITGLNNSMAHQIESLGSNAVYVSRFKPGIQLGRRSSAERNRKPITYEHAMAIKENCSAVRAVSPENHYHLPGGNTAKYKGNEARRPDLAGVLPDYQAVNNISCRHGRFISELDHHFRRMVCVLGPDIAETLFPSLDPLGKSILVNNHRFTVIGVTEKREAILGTSQDNYILLPYGTFAKLHPWEKELWLACAAASADKIELAVDQITEVMRRERGLKYDDENDFAVFTQDSLMEIYRQITGMIYVAMTVISSIGLMVGGVGVMNIMLVSVTERTREIGVRKAIGARRANIVWQFLIEAMALSGVGGIVGIVFGLALAFFIKAMDWLPAGVSIPWVIIGFTVAVSVGLIFGIYPAYRAAKVDPIVSLRYE
jgi:putative ABC transport system permease protein